MTESLPSKAAPWMRDTLREGFAYLQAGQPERASQCCRRVLGARRDLPEGHFLVGLVALELNERRTAIEAFGSVTRLQPDHAAAWANLARLFLLAGWPARADSALAKAMETTFQERGLDVTGVCELSDLSFRFRDNIAK